MEKWERLSVKRDKRLAEATEQYIEAEPTGKDNADLFHALAEAYQLDHQYFTRYLDIYRKECL